MTSRQSFLERFGIDRSTAILFGLAILLLTAAWWVRETSVQFNRLPLWLGTGILTANVALSVLAGRRDATIGYLLAGTAILVELLLLILIVMARVGRIV